MATQTSASTLSYFTPPTSILVPDYPGTNTSAPALRTKFTPPATCFSNVFTTGTDVHQDRYVTNNKAAWAGGMYRGAKSECYPSNFSAIVTSGFRTVSSVATLSITSQFKVLSPGICPESYTVQVQQYIGASTIQTCCPFGMTLDTRSSGSNWCQSWPGAGFMLASSTGERIGQGTTTTLYTTNTATGVSIFAYPFIVAWQSTDLDVISPESAQSTPATFRNSLVDSAPLISSTSSMSSTSTFPVSSSRVTPVSTAEPPIALSPGAKAGIGVGIAFGVVVLIGAIWLALWWRHKRHVTAKNAAEPMSKTHEKAELPGEGTAKPTVGLATELDGSNLVHEFDGQRDPVEVDNTTARAELDTGWRGWEASAK